MPKHGRAVPTADSAAAARKAIAAAGCHLLSKALLFVALALALWTDLESPLWLFALLTAAAVAGVIAQAFDPELRHHHGSDGGGGGGGG
ncbi:MAG: hypothetical protein LC777_02015 [Actinobacteria bacterium]|nr:hypothetical protein [Actinomycetota bacterium]